MSDNTNAWPKYMDAHGHPNFFAYKNDREETIERALKAGVWLNVVGTQKDTSRDAVFLAKKYDKGVYATIGLHPIHTDKSFHDEEELGDGNREFTSRGEDFDYEYYKALAQSPKVVAIGECGLDFYRLKPDDSGCVEKIEKQRKVFRRQIELSVETKKPLMLHLRSGDGVSAYREAYAILTDYKSRLFGGDLHFFAGSWEEAELFLGLGFNFSFTGVVTFARSYDAIVKALPLERIMVETDCPYVSPAPYRGKRNEPAYVVETARKIAEIRSEDESVVQTALLRNTLSFFGLKAG